MANVLHKQTLEYRKSVHTPDYMDDNWLINPKLPDCDPKFWKITGNKVVEMDSVEKEAVLAAEKDATDASAALAERNRLIQERMWKIAEDQLIAEGIID